MNKAEYLNEVLKRVSPSLFKRLITLYPFSDAIKQQEQPEPEHKFEVFNKFVQVMKEFNDEQPEYELSDYDYLFIYQVAMHLGFDDMIGLEMFVNQLHNNPQVIYENVKDMRREGLIPIGILGGDDPDIAYINCLLDPKKLTTPPKHPLYLSIGINHSGELYSYEGIIKLWDNITNACKAFIKAQQCAFKNQGKSERLEYVDSIPESSPCSCPQIDYINAAQRIAYFCEIAGINFDALPTKDQDTILELLEAIEAGYEIGSKQGVSLKALYGDEYEVKSRQQRRLFERIRGKTISP